MENLFACRNVSKRLGGFVLENISFELKRGYIRKMVSAGTSSVIYASHLVEEMEEFADYILWLGQEKSAANMKFFGSTDELRERYRMVEADEKIAQSIPKELIVGGRKRENHRETLVLADKRILTGEVRKFCRYPDLREIIYNEEKQKEGVCYDKR